MPKKTLDIIDESGDKKYFTIIPNYILNHSSANDQALYLQMKRLANDNEICYASEKYFMDKLSIGRQSLKKSMQYLIDHKWINFAGYREAQTKGGKQNVKTYKIVDLWKLNIDHYHKGVSETTPLTKTKGVSETTQRGVQNDTQGVSETTPKKNNTRRTKNILSLDSDWQKNMFYSKDRRMPIIAYYWNTKGIKPTNRDQYDSALKRELRPAGLLKGYENEKIKKVILWLEENSDFKWTLETVHKYIDENLEKLDSKTLTEDDLINNILKK